MWENIESELRKKAEGSALVEKVLAAATTHASPLAAERKAYHDALAQTFRIAAISHMAVAARDVFKKRYREIMNGEYHQELLMDVECDARPLVRASKEILRSELYRHPDILRLEVRGRKVIHDLLDCFWEGVKNYEQSKRIELSPATYAGKLYFLLSENYRRGFERRMTEGKENELYCKLQLITDQVASMTDTHACEIHRRLTSA